MKKLLLLLIILLLPFTALAQLTTQQGGTGSTTPSGILYGNGTLHLGTVTIGSNLTFIGGILSATGGGSTFGTTSISALFPLSWNTTTAVLSFLGLGTTSPFTAGNIVTVSNSNTLTSIPNNFATFGYPFPSNATSTNITFSGGLTGTLTGNAATVTNGVYTTTFNGLFDNRLSASSSISGITTLPNLSLPYSQLTSVPAFLTSYDAFTHPAIGQSATTSTLFLNGGASTTNLDIFNVLNIGPSSTTTIKGNATSTFGGGINLGNTGCFAIGNTCIGAPGTFVTGTSLPVNYATTGTLPSYTYSLGVITEVGNGALSVDGNSPAVTNRILVKNESGACMAGSGACNNGIYTVTAAGSAIAAFVLTRATDYNSSSNVYPGIATYVISGATLNDDWWAMTSAAPITIGTTALNYTETSSGITAAIQSLGPANQLQTGATQTLATSTDTNLGLTITASGNTQTFTTVWNGTLSTARGGLGGNFGASTGALSVSGGTVSAGILSYGNGGTGTTTAPISQLLYGGSSAYQSVATSSVTNGAGISFTGTAGALVGGSSLTITNTGVTSLAAGTGISVSGSTGAVTITNTGSTFAYPFTPTTNFGVLTSATSTNIYDTLGLFASSTSSFGTAGNALTIDSDGRMSIGAAFPVNVQGINVTETGTVDEGILSVQAGSNTNNYAFYGQAFGAMVNNWAFYNAGGNNYLGTGVTGIGSSTPFSALSVGSGTASSSITVAEYKYGAGSNVATSTTQNIDCNASTQIAEPIGTSALTLTLVNLTPGKKCIVVVQNPGSGTAGAITWAVQSNSILKWAGGTTPTQTTTANTMDIWSFLDTRGSSTNEIIGAATLNN